MVESKLEIDKRDALRAAERAWQGCLNGKPFLLGGDQLIGILLSLSQSGGQRIVFETIDEVAGSGWKQVFSWFRGQESRTFMFIGGQFLQLGIHPKMIQLGAVFPNPIELRDAAFMAILASFERRCEADEELSPGAIKRNEGAEVLADPNREVLIIQNIDRVAEGGGSLLQEFTWRLSQDRSLSFRALSSEPVTERVRTLYRKLRVLSANC